MSIKHKYLSSKNLSHAEIEFLKDIKDSVVLVSPYKTTYDIFGLGSSEQKYFYAMTNVNKEANCTKTLICSKVILSINQTGVHGRTVMA